MLAHQGLYSVPISLQLFTLAILLIFKNYKKILHKLINIKLNIFFIRAFIFLIIIIILISPYIYVAYFEVDNIVRTGRDLSKFNWSNFLEASQGVKGLERFNYFSTRISSNHPPIFYFGISSFFFAVVGFFSSSKRYLYLKCFFLFCFTVFLHEYSVFLNLYYNFLFPYLTKIAYWGVLYDNLVFFYLIFIGLGFEIFMKMINNNRSLDYKLYLIVTISILIYLVGVEFYTAIPWILFCLIFLLNSIRFIFDKKISSLFLLLLLVEQIIYIGFYSQKWLMSSFQNDSSFYRTGENIKGYEFQNNREIKRSALDAHGFFPLINRKDYFWMGENSPFVQYKNSFNLVERFKDKPKKLFQLFGVDSDVIEITTNVKIVNNEKELWEKLNQNSRYPIIINGISPSKQLCESESNLHYIENIKLRPGRLLIKLNISTCAYLIWRETYHPDWQVHIDGSVNEILKVDGNFMVFYLERSGFHTITFHFYPKYFVILYLFSILLQSILIFYFLGLLNRKNFSNYSPEKK